MSWRAWWQWLSGWGTRRQPYLPVAEWRSLAATIPVLQGLSEPELERLIALAERFCRPSALPVWECGLRDGNSAGWRYRRACRY